MSTDKAVPFSSDNNNVRPEQYLSTNQKSPKDHYDDTILPSNHTYDSVVPVDSPESKPPLEDDNLEPCGGMPGKIVHKFWSSISHVIKSQTSQVKNVVVIILYILLFTYMGVVVYKFTQSDTSDIDWRDGYGFAFILFTIILWSLFYYKILHGFILPKTGCPMNWCSTQHGCMSRIFRILGCIVLVLAVIGYLAFLIYDTRDERQRLISFGGICAFLCFGFLFSKHPNYINWRTVGSGVGLQLLIGTLTIRWETGRAVFETIGKKVETFLEYGYQGAEFAYGHYIVYDLKVFAFQALSVLMFIAMIVQILFYYGWLQAMCFKLGGLIQSILGTTVIESVSAVGTSFIGMSEAPLMCKPYLKYLTASELHAIMAAGFATVAGSLLAAYTSLGVDPRNVITVSAMAAPAALGFSKLFYPENKKSKTTSSNLIIYKSEDNSVIDAACKGAFSGIEIVQGIIANVVACVSMIAFINGLLSWFGWLVGIDGLKLEVVLGKCFIPVAYAMGVTPNEVDDVAKLIGIKTAINEFVAYQELGVMKKANKLSVRSEAIATFALCGFANPSSVGIAIATISALCPEQRQNVSKVAIRSFIAGSCTSFISACVAGLLMPEAGFDS